VTERAEGGGEWRREKGERVRGMEVSEEKRRERGEAHLVLQVRDLARVESTGGESKVGELDVARRVNQEVLQRVRSRQYKRAHFP
jgi:hypothetical protein